MAMKTPPRPDLKEVGTADGLLHFRVPATWANEVEADGSAAFWDEDLDAGTLRVKVMTFTTEEDLTGGVNLARRQLEGLEPAEGQTLEALPSGNALRIHQEESDEPGELTAFHVWMLASIDPPHRMRLAVFSFAVRARDARAPATRRAVATLDKEIRSARFAHQVS